MNFDNADSIPQSVRELIDTDQIIARIDLGGGDAIFVTATQTIQYQSQRLLNNELTETYQHDIERIAVSEKRNKPNRTLMYDVADTAESTVIVAQIDDILTSILTGMLHTIHAITSDEIV